jgi:hypothetical protein
MQSGIALKRLGIAGSNQNIRSGTELMDASSQWGIPFDTPLTGVFLLR